MEQHPVHTIEAQLDYHDERLLGAFADDQTELDKENDPEFAVLAESDPDGIVAGEPGAKLDAGKCDIGLLFESFPRALFAVAEVATFGANKYSRGGWKEVKGGMVRYAAAEGRHKLYRYMGELRDKDSQLPHRYHEVWNALAQLEFDLVSGELS